jgi:hypothetical protein
MRLEFEGMLRVQFADQCDLEQLERSIKTIAEQARTGRAQFAAMANAILESGGEFPQRLHVNALGMRFIIDHYHQVVSWTDWALASLRTRDDTTTGATTSAGPPQRFSPTLASRPPGRRPPLPGRGCSGGKA